MASERLIKLPESTGSRWADNGPAGRDYRPLDAEERALTLFEAFRQAAGHRADAVAAASAEGTLSFDALLRDSLALAARLATAGVRAGQPVLVLAPQGPAHVRAMLACWRIGAAYVPLDPLNPPLRLRHIAAQCPDAPLVAAAGAEETASGLVPAARIVALDGDAPDNAALPPLPSPQEPAFVVFTSGTTGLPKGVVKSQAAVLDAAAMRIDLHHLRAGDALAYLGGPAVSANVNHVAAALLAGATIVLGRRDQSPSALLDLVARHHVTHLAAYAGHVLALARAEGAAGRLATVEDIALFGDAVTWPDIADLRAALAPGVLISSIYGQTEASTTMFWFIDDRGAGTADRVPIGHPMPGAECWIAPLDDDTGDGSSLRGELCVAGPRVATAYWGDEALTAERFLAHPDDPGRLALRTGDIVTVPIDGPVELVGRADNMVKMRGWRIEIEDIETAARALPGVALAGVVTRTAPSGAVVALALYLAAASGAELQADDIAAALRQRLPSYMSPAAIAILPALPLTATGKIDRIRLAEIDARTQATDAMPAADRSGAWPDELHARVARTIATEISLTTVDPDRRFIEQGGDSLHAIGACLRIERLFGVPLDPEDFLDDLTLGRLVHHIAARIRAPT